MRRDPTGSSPPVLPQLSSYLPAPSSDTRTSSVAITGITSGLKLKKRRNSIEGTFSAVSPRLHSSHHSESELLKRKQSSPAISVHDDTERPNAAAFSRLSSLYATEGQTSPLITSDGLSYSSASSPQGSDISDVKTTRYFASQPAVAAPRRERTSRYLSEGDRREIITRIDAGEKQVTLAREFCVSRAAICNLYKNRWEVLTRGSRNPESKHPKKTRGRKVSPQQTSTSATELSIAAPEPAPVCPDVSTISIRSEESPRDDQEDSTGFQLQSENDENEGGNHLSVVAPDQFMHHQLQHKNHFQGEADELPRDQRSHLEGIVGDVVVSRPFLVHEASAYSYPCRNLVAALRDESISTVVFQQRATRLARLLIEEALTCLPHEDVEITNQFGDVCHGAKSLEEHGICGISMEDKGMVLLRAFSTISPTSPTGVMTVDTRTTDASPSIVHTQLPPITPRQAVLLLDIECATGEEVCAVLRHLVRERQIDAKRIYLVTIISSFEGLQKVFRHFPGVSLITAQVDTVVDVNKRIRPGIGNFMQRFWNVQADSTP
ncbi:Uracil phosphoribosyltransferase [Phytophthora cinnamomi]|uniref:Uracil phosphoribosyltransferase n=1 Tax=Phytophthora cinnamomi TaxID=4785 RepID=UPI003559EEC5|nr:Uracil phosphoribosyltransferase [Phytophthora cinnamomi]